MQAPPWGGENSLAGHQKASYCQMIEMPTKKKDWRGLSNIKICSSKTSFTQMNPLSWLRPIEREKKPWYKPKPKHCVKVDIWAGIRYRGCTTLSIFEWKMSAPLFVSILERSLPLLRLLYKHCSNYAKRFHEELGINWWPTPPESPGLNPIKNLWHKPKEYIWQRWSPEQSRILSLE